MGGSQCGRVLVVEDDRQIADFVGKGLTEAGFDVDVVQSGIDGFELAAQGVHDVLVLDIMLPGMDG
ncbi:MAG: DNA-binding response regulator, partial [Planctomycetaceae bacterium]